MSYDKCSKCGRTMTALLVTMSCDICDSKQTKTETFFSLPYVWYTALPSSWIKSYGQSHQLPRSCVMKKGSLFHTRMAAERSRPTWTVVKALIVEEFDLDFFSIKVIEVCRDQ